VIQGGTWAGKTYGIIAVLIDQCARTKDSHITVVAESIPAIKAGALANFKEIMYSTNRWREDNYNATDKIYTFASGSKIEFTAFDSIGKAQAHGKRTDLFLNECYHIPYPIADSLIGRTSSVIWFDYNPIGRFWVHDEIANQEDAELIVLVPKDNEAIPDSIRAEHEQRREKAKTSSFWANWCRVYLDGEIGSVDGLVFPEYELIDEFPDIYEVYGMDFGFTADPTTLMKVGERDGIIYVDQLIYKKNTQTNDICGMMKQLGVTSNHVIYGDSSEPRTIDDIMRQGFLIKPCVKGPDSIIAGINYMRERQLKVTKRSLELIKELSNYMFIQDKNGNQTNTPVDAFNHCIDAIRYACYSQYKEYSGRVNATLITI
jgi:phage terminase large subunit